jgi:hypothetical protein
LNGLRMNPSITACRPSRTALVALSRLAVITTIT